VNIKNLLELSSVDLGYSDYESAWSGHAPFAYWLVTEKAPNIVVELGTHYGNSYFSFCRAVKNKKLPTKCYGIDTWTGDVHAGGYDNEVYNQVLGINNKNYCEFSFLIRSKFDDAVKMFKDASIDILHIDGLHSYEAVKNDFDTWLVKLAPGAVILFHDTCADIEGFGVKQFWSELKSKYKYHFDFFHSFGLGVLQLPARGQDPLYLLSADCHFKSEIREYFVMLGELHSSRFEKSALIRSNSIQEERIKDLTWYLETRINVIAKLEKEFADYKKTYQQISILGQKFTTNLSESIKKILFLSRIKKVFSSSRALRYLRENGILFTAKKVLFFIKTYGLRSFFFKLISHNISDESANLKSEIPFSESGSLKPAALYLRNRFLGCRKINFAQRDELIKSCVNLITDSVGKSSLFGGVGTAIILAVKLANHMNFDLRVITRTESTNVEDLNQFFKLQKISLMGDVFLTYAGPESEIEVTYSMNDIFLTTSWWSTSSVLDVVPSEKILYLIQEDERMFYSFGDDRLRAEEVMKRSDIRFFVNTKILYDYFLSDDLSFVASNWDWFEPAFPHFLYKKTTNLKKKSKSKKKFFFYARPNNPRNLFARGLEAIEFAIERNIINLDEWDIYFVGKHIPNLILSKAYVPIYLDGLSWKEYSDFISDVDVALSLMYTPHPSYPPLDLAASGALVVTNTFDNKTSLSKYSENIIMSHTDLESLLGAIDEAIRKNHRNDRLTRTVVKSSLVDSWDEAFSKILT
jgi:hypothetical protein